MMKSTLMLLTVTAGLMLGHNASANTELIICKNQLAKTERKLSDLERVLYQCQNSQQGPSQPTPTVPYELEQLRSENRRLNEVVYSQTGRINQLEQENYSLRREIDYLKGIGHGGSLGHISVAACRRSSGAPDLRYIASGEGQFSLEAESEAREALSKKYSCNYGIHIVSTEQIKNTQTANFCVAGCLASSGSVNTSYTKAGRGRNVTEAQFNAMAEVNKTWSCNYGVEVLKCE